MILMSQQVYSGNFTLVLLPDTQYYSRDNPEIFDNQTQWIVNNKDSLNIAFVAHLGDLVQTGTNTTQWDRVNTSMSKLDEVVNYSVLAGNHDYNVIQSRTLTNYNTYFNYTRYEGYSYYGGHYPSNGNENNYNLFSADGYDIVLLNLEFCPNDNTLTWANEVFTNYSDRKKIVVTHSYLGSDGLRIDDSSLHACHGVTGINHNTGEDMYDKLITQHSDIILVVGGHSSGSIRKRDIFNGYSIMQTIHNYQEWANGGNGYLSYYTFDLSNDLVTVKSYSPYLNLYDTLYGAQFTFGYLLRYVGLYCG